ncbi:MAG: hypothetical protein DLM57_13980, partial [Pseudonocardiales bacterium]
MATVRSARASRLPGLASWRSLSRCTDPLGPAQATPRRVPLLRGQAWVSGCLPQVCRRASGRQTGTPRVFGRPVRATTSLRGSTAGWRYPACHGSDLSRRPDRDVPRDRRAVVLRRAQAAARPAVSEPAPDAADLRSGAPIHDNLLALLPLVGVWQGTGAGVVASTGAQFGYGQQIRFVHDGRPFLAYESRTWLVGDDGEVLRQAWRES